MGRCVRVLTDSVADLPSALVDRFQIKVVPVSVLLDGRPHRDDKHLDREWFYDRLRYVTERPTTAAPAPRAFAEAYAELAAEGADEILALVTASTVSSIYDHATLAASSFGSLPVHVVDTTQITMGLGWLVVEAAQQLAGGAVVPEVVEAVSRLRERTHVFGLIDAVDYLRRSGRVSWISGAIAGLLKIKPLITFQQGGAELLGRVRTRARGGHALLSQVGTLRPLRRLALLHSRADLSWVGQIHQALAALVPDLDIPVIEVGPVFATHVGPGCLGVALIEES